MTPLNVNIVAGLVDSCYNYNISSPLKEPVICCFVHVPGDIKFMSQLTYCSNDILRHSDAWKLDIYCYKITMNRGVDVQLN